MLEIDGLTKVYRYGVRGIENLSLHVRSGELFCLLGPNGSGKTTTISLLFGFMAPTRGHARICGHDVVRESLSARRVAAYVPENVSLYGNLTAMQNLTLFAELSGFRGDRLKGVRGALDSVGLGRADQMRRVRDFSKGMRQRVGLSIALVRECPVVVLDEPTSGLDPRAADDLVAVLERLRDEGRAILMCTHDIHRAEQVADRVGVLRQGRLVAVLDRKVLDMSGLGRAYRELSS